MNNYLMNCDKGMINDDIPFKKYNFQSDVLDKITKLSRGVDKNIFKRKKIDKNFFLKNTKYQRKIKLFYFVAEFMN